MEVTDRERAKEIILKIKQENPKHYTTLIKRHYSSIFDMVTAFNKANFDQVSNSQKFYNFCFDIECVPMCPILHTVLKFNNVKWEYRKYSCRGVRTPETIEASAIKRRGKRFVKRRQTIKDCLPLAFSDIVREVKKIGYPSLSIICQRLIFKYPVLAEQIKMHFNYTAEVPFKAMVYCVCNNIDKIPLCKYDNTSACTFINGEKGFKDYNIKNIKQYKKDNKNLKELTKVKILTLEETELQLRGILDQLNSFQNLSQSIMSKNIQLYQSIKYFAPKECKTFSHKCYFILNGKPIKSKDRVKLHFESFNQGYSERFLYSGCSRGEEELSDFIKSLGLIPTKKRKKLKEIDIFVEEKNIGFEYNGEYYHSFMKLKNKNYHIDKTILMKTYGIDLIHIWESEWYNKKNIIKSIIRSKLNSDITRIGARTCDIKTVSKEEKKIFLNTNHIQGDDKSSLTLGLYKGEELMCLMTFGTRKITGVKTFELLRFCNKLNTSVTGGASKLFKFFLKNIWTGEKITTYCDVRFSPSTNFYTNLGFKLKKRSECNYYYFKPQLPKYIKLLHRSNFMKHTLQHKLEKFDANMTEQQNMLNNGYLYLYDCGHYVYEYK
jgi:hypothetical protein